MALDDYRGKREFKSTPEPVGRARKRTGARPIFVVQLHHASHRHYDFRLQVGGTLKSWAVPKGPSLDPQVKRMAVEVEDHPLDYAGFEGDIPKGNYGGGHVAVFDRGTWTTDLDVEAQLAKGHLRFELHGEKLKGGWHLVRSGKPARQPQWLLFKQDDAWAGSGEADDMLDDVAPAPAEDAKRARRPGTKTKTVRKPPAPTKKRARSANSGKSDWHAEALELPGARRRKLAATPPVPQLAKLVDDPPDGDDWLHELKWDGYRLVCAIRAGKPSLLSRNALDWSERVSEVRDAIELLGLQEAVLDGELVAGQGSREDFNELQQILSGEIQGTLRYVVFDLLHLEGVDLSEVPLLRRKQLLERLLATAPTRLAYSSHGIGNPSDAFKAAVDAGFEGIVSKRIDATVHPGRSDAWRKTKALGSDEFAVVGYTPPKGSRTGIGALLLATPDEQHGWRYVGRVGSGFNDAQLASLGKRLQGKGSTKPSVHVPENDTDLRQARWFPKPAFVVEVFTRGLGGRGLLRQASFKAMRADKTVASLHDSDLGTASDSKTTEARSVAKKPTKSVRKTGKARQAPELSSPGKLLFPDNGISKQSLADYYSAVMDWLLPEIRDRPLSLVRCPSGIGAQCFFQKHATPGFELVSLVPVTESDGGSEDYLAVTDAASAMELVQFNAIEFHPWGSKVADLEHADRLVFDLDPDEAVAWKDVIVAARQLRDFLEQAGLQSFVRTSGGKGLHLVVPLAPAAPWERARAFSQAVAEAAREMDPLRYIATASKQKRKGKIFIDWLRNGRGATSIASFSVRARPGAPVAMPLRWEELGKVASGHAFDIRNVPARLKRLKSHPWEGIEKVRQSLPD
ncbi:DNA ligase D [Thermomonas carbonis]|uniref:DNA ligase (ATP) n=1 Tax=Thermomonas carbonis TaxID=1463158 RepID=A0A7G9SUP1_9GAMM|nr:DNA ligase D [Thermomonas carbonis]QNN71566.1 DNA ligase D [Thermomonas carbonis]